MKLVQGFATLALALTVSASSTLAQSKDIVDTAISAGSFQTLVAAAQAAGLVDALKGGPITVFAPTDEAFAKLPEGTVQNLLKPENKAKLAQILTYHVVSGKVTADQVVKLTGAKTLSGQWVDISTDSGVKVDQANVVKTDIVCSNGVIHVIDSVILPEEKNLAEVATAAGSFSTLVAAAQAAGLVGALTGEENLTVFAPTDDAFAKLPAGTVENLLKPENRGQLTKILTYHIVPGRVYSTDALSAGDATTLAGGSVHIAISGGAAKVNNATLLKTDIDAANGVIHVIDTVLLPPETTGQVHPAVETHHHPVSATTSTCPASKCSGSN